MTWYSLDVPPTVLRLRSLICGQSFRWVVTGKDEYTSTLQNQIVTLKETEDDILYTLGNDVGHDAELVRSWLVDYFRLTLQIQPHFEAWCRADPAHFHRKTPAFPGLRMIRQPPFECLCSFICSSNNHIARITGMVQNLAVHFGEPVPLGPARSEKEAVPQMYRNRVWYTFPAPERLVDAEAKLRQLGFGYRAKYIQETARRLVSLGGESYLYNLRKVPRADAHVELLQFAGVGPKVADCVALSSLDHLDAVPVDVHVLRIATRDYGFRIPAGKSLTIERYNEAADLYRKKFGPLAGWAQLILFGAELRQFKTTSTVSQRKSIAVAVMEEGTVWEESESTLMVKEEQEEEAEESILIESVQTELDLKGRVVRRSRRVSRVMP